MFPTGLLVLTTPLQHLQHQIGAILSGAAHHVENTLYVHLAPELQPGPPGTQRVGEQQVPVSTDAKRVMIALYSQAASVCNQIDIHLLLGNITNKRTLLRPCSISSGFNVILADANPHMEDRFLLEYIKQNFSVENDFHVTKLDPSSQPHDGKVSEWNLKAVNEAQCIAGDEGKCNVYDNVVLGGTFDRLHAGHKILLSEACMISEKSVTVGVTQGKMNEKKTFGELMEPTDTRIRCVTEFLQRVKPSIKPIVVPITDPFGPSIVDPDLQCIVVSHETLGGGKAVNKRREEKGLSTLDVDVIELIEDVNHSPEEEEKISSSSQRKRLLGTLLKPPKGDVQSRPYIIGMTGGIASGKSNVCKTLDSLGAVVIDCDKLGHAAYGRDTPTQQKVVDAFGADILTEDGHINRKALGAKVFTDKAQLEKLNNIVWPAIAELARTQIAECSKQGVEVVVLDAAVLLEAGWDSMVQEIWVSIIPRDEAIKRIMQRNNLSEEESIQRIDSQITNHQRVAQANVVLSTLYDYPVTQKQVEKAWELLKSRLSSN